MIGNKLLMKILLCLDEKPPNLVRNWEKKPDRSINKKLSNSRGDFEKKNWWLLSKSQNMKREGINGNPPNSVGN